MPRNLFEQFFSTREQRNQNAPPIVAAASSADVSMQLQPIDQFDSAVMLQCQPIGERADSGFFSFGKATDREQ